MKFEVIGTKEKYKGIEMQILTVETASGIKVVVHDDGAVYIDGKHVY